MCAQRYVLCHLCEMYIFTVAAMPQWNRCCAIDSKWSLPRKTFPDRWFVLFADRGMQSFPKIVQRTQTVNFHGTRIAAWCLFEHWKPLMLR